MNKNFVKSETWNSTIGGAGKVMKSAGGLTLGRRSGGDSSSSTSLPKLLSLSVIGLSGGEKEKGALGVGKSCLCNRFINPAADSYSTDHISVFSQSDFCGRVINNDHFLYWGQVQRTNSEGILFNIQVIEQTEFIDDTSFMPFRSPGTSETYIKRCTSTKLVSAEKLMYICKDQLGLEKEYPEKLLPDGKFIVDGFLIVFDVSLVPNRSVERQLEFCSQIITNLIRIKKPFAIAISKVDEACELNFYQVEKLVNRKDLKAFNVPVIETSAFQNINVSAAFFTLAQLIDKTRGKTRLQNYYEASISNREAMDEISDSFLRLIRRNVTDYGDVWSVAQRHLLANHEYEAFVEAFGQHNALITFKRHIAYLKEEFINERVEEYLQRLPHIILELVPEIQHDSNWNWLTLVAMIQKHKNFANFFVEYGEDTNWMEEDLFDGGTSESRVPVDILDLAETENVVRKYLGQVNLHRKQLELKKEFKLMLEQMGYVTPGKTLEEMTVLFLGRDCYENLPMEDISKIYEMHQTEICEKARNNFQELLLENPEIFEHYRSASLSTVSQDDIQRINEAIEEDSRYKALDRLSSDRKLVLLQHVGFIHHPLREHCPAKSRCTDLIVVNKFLDVFGEQSSNVSKIETQIIANILLFQQQRSDTIGCFIKDLCEQADIYCMGKFFCLKFEIIYEIPTANQNDAETTKPIAMLWPYFDRSSFEYIRNLALSVDQNNLAINGHLENKNSSFMFPPIVILFATDFSVLSDEKQIARLKQDGENLAQKLSGSIFLDASISFRNNAEKKNQTFCPKFSSKRIVKCLKEMLEFVYDEKLTFSSIKPDIRIIVCMNCGDAYNFDTFLDAITASGYCTPKQTSNNSFVLNVKCSETFTEMKVEIIVTSYHNVDKFVNELVYGFILVYSGNRKASFANLRMFSKNIANIPIMINGIYENDFGAYKELCQILLQNGNCLAQSIGAFFRPINDYELHSNYTIELVTYFFSKVFEKRLEIEKAYIEFSNKYNKISNMDKNSRSDANISSVETNLAFSSVSNSDLYSHQKLSTASVECSTGARSKIWSSKKTEIQPEDEFSSNDQLQNTSYVPTTSSMKIDDDYADMLLKPSQVKKKMMEGLCEQAIFDRGSTNVSTEDVSVKACNIKQLSANLMAQSTQPIPEIRKMAPGKLNLDHYLKLSNAITNMNIDGTKKNFNLNEEAPLASSEDLIEENALKDAIIAGSCKISNKSKKPNVRERRETLIRNVENSDTSDSESFDNSEGIVMVFPRVSRRSTTKGGSIPVATPKVPNLPDFVNAGIPLVEEKVVSGRSFLNYVTSSPNEEDGQQNSPVLSDKERRKEQKQRMKEIAKDEKRRLKLEKDRQKELKKWNDANSSKAVSLTSFKSITEFRKSGDENLIPTFLEKAFSFIERNGLDAEGLYRVPGNRVNVEFILNRYEKDSNFCLDDLDVSVNAVATAIKDYILRSMPKILTPNVMNEFETISVLEDSNEKAVQLRNLLKNLPETNFEVLKFIFQHFVRVTECSQKNCMDSKNLSICWWPTLFPFEFENMGKFESMRPHLENTLQMMIEKFSFIFGITDTIGGDGATV